VRGTPARGGFPPPRRRQASSQDAPLKWSEDSPASGDAGDRLVPGAGGVDALARYLSVETLRVSGKVDLPAPGGKQARSAKAGATEGALGSLAYVAPAGDAASASSFVLESRALLRPISLDRGPAQIDAAGFAHRPNESFRQQRHL